MKVREREEAKEKTRKIASNGWEMGESSDINDFGKGIIARFGPIFYV